MILSNLVKMLTTNVCQDIVRMHEEEIVGLNADNPEIESDLKKIGSDFFSKKIITSILEYYFGSNHFSVVSVGKKDNIMSFITQDREGRIIGNITFKRRLNG